MNKVLIFHCGPVEKLMSYSLCEIKEKDPKNQSIVFDTRTNITSSDGLELSIDRSDRLLGPKVKTHMVCLQLGLFFLTL